MRKLIPRKLIELPAQWLFLPIALVALAISGLFGGLRPAERLRRRHGPRSARRSTESRGTRPSCRRGWREALTTCQPGHGRPLDRGADQSAGDRGRADLGARYGTDSGRERSGQRVTGDAGAAPGRGDVPEVNPGFLETFDVYWEQTPEPAPRTVGARRRVQRNSAGELVHRPADLDRSRGARPPSRCRSAGSLRDRPGPRADPQPPDALAAPDRPPPGPGSPGPPYWSRSCSGTRSRSTRPGEATEQRPYVTTGAGRHTVSTKPFDATVTDVRGSAAVEVDLKKYTTSGVWIVVTMRLLAHPASRCGSATPRCLTPPATSTTSRPGSSAPAYGCQLEPGVHGDRTSSSRCREPSLLDCRSRSRRASTSAWVRWSGSPFRRHRRGLGLPGEQQRSDRRRGSEGGGVVS